MNETLFAKKPMFYRHRMLSAGQGFEASTVDAEYFVRRGDAHRAPVADKPKPFVKKTISAIALVLEPSEPVVSALLPDSNVKEDAPTLAVESSMVDEAAPRDVAPAPASDAAEEAAGAPVAPVSTVSEPVVTQPRRGRPRGQGSRS